jgi:hypothetical protein
LLYYESLTQTVSKEVCLRIEIEAQLQEISYNQLQDFIQIANKLNILKEITPFI